MNESSQVISRSLEIALALHREGRVAEAGEIYRRILQIEPGNADALHLLGLASLQEGQKERALELISRAVEKSPREAHMQNNLGEAYRSLGKFEEAMVCYQEAVALKPDFPEAYNNMGIIFHERGETEPAVSCYVHAAALRDGYVEAMCNAGAALKESGRLDDALRYYEKVREIRPDFMDVYHQVGAILHEMGRIDQEVNLYRRALSIRRDSPDVWADLGAVLHEQGQVDEAIECYKSALSMRPIFPEVLNNLGMAYRMKGCPKEALDSFEKALNQRPDYGEALINLGTSCYEDDHYPEAIVCFQKAIEVKPDLASGYENLGMVYAEIGDMETATDFYKKAYSLSSRNGTAVKMATLMPVIMGSPDEIENRRRRLKDHIGELMKRGLEISDPVKEIGKMNFYLPYHGLNDRDLQTDLAGFYRASCPSLTFTAPHVNSGRGAGKEAKIIKIGFVSRYLRDHTVGKYVRGLIAHLNRERFRVHTFSFPQKPDVLSRFIETHSDTFTTLTPSLKAARAQIADQELDILFYPDIGMESFTYFLAFSRLAPVQCVFYGHPVTTGIDTIDYFISHEDCETTNSEGHYSEQLVKLSGSVTYTYFYKPEIGAFTKKRGDFGLSPSAHIYYCPQSLFKIHPDFDAMAADILKADPKGILLLVNGKHQDWTSMLRQRLLRALKDSGERLMFLPMQSYQSYLNMLALSDVVLDTPHFNGGSTTFDALAVGTPAVTLPGEFLRGRQTYSLYKRMGVMDCVGKSREGYVEIALRLANDMSYREEIKGKIVSRNQTIFEDMETVKELETLLVTMLSKKS